MKNTECRIYIITKHGCTQSYRKGKNGWTQTSPNGKVRLLSTEQLLSHILPPLAGIGQVTVRVEPDNRDIKHACNLHTREFYEQTVGWFWNRGVVSVTDPCNR
jgi:hypothetical protein